MINNLNKSLPKEIKDLKLKEALDLALQPEKVEELSSFSTPTDVINEKPVLPSKSVDTVIQQDTDPLANLGKVVQGQVEGQQIKPLLIDLDEYAPYFGGNVGYVSNKEGLDIQRASNQSAVSQFKNASARVALNVIPEVVAQVGNILDLEDYYNGDAEAGNWLNTAMQKIEADVDKANPIYRRNPDTPLDFSDSAWWAENGSSLVKSAAAFAAVGYGTGLAAGKLFSSGAQSAKWLTTLGETAEAGTALAKGSQIGAQLATAVALNQAEGIGIATDTFKQSYDKNLTDIRASEKGASMSEQEIQEEANNLAAIDATSALNFNKWNILLNVTSAGLFMKTPTSINTLAKKTNLLNTAKHIGLEGTQEYIEEIVNDVSTQQALDKDYTFTKAMDYALTDQGIESGLLGFIGGAGQTALTLAGKSIPMYQNRAYNQAYSQAYNSITTPNISDEERSAKANEIAIQAVGNDKNRVSANFLNNQRYIEQQDKLALYNTMSDTDKIKDVTSAFNTAEETIELQKEIVEAKNKGELAKANDLENKLFSQQAYQAFDTGTIDGFKEIYKAYENLSKEDAEAKGIYKEGDENTPQYYKTIAKDKLKDIDALGKIYLNSSAYINSNQLYSIEENKYNTNKSLEKVNTQIEAAIKNAEEVYKFNDSLNPSKQELSLDNVDGSKDIKFFAEEHKVYPAYRRINDLIKTKEILQNNINTLQNTYDVVASNEFQDNLANKITANREKQKRERKQTKVKSETAVRNNQVRQDINVLRTEANDVTANTNEVSPVVTPSPVIEEDRVGEEGTPEVVEKPEVVSNKTKLKSLLNIQFPTIPDAGLNQQLQELVKTTGTYDYYAEDSLARVDFFKDIFNNQTDGLKQVMPLHINEIESIKDSLNKMSEHLKATIIVKNEVKEAARDRARDFMDSFETAVEPTITGEVDASPNVAPDFSLADSQYDMLKGILADVHEAGLDYTDFKTVVQYLHDMTSANDVIKHFSGIKNVYNVVMNANIEGSYQQIMFTQAQKQEAVNAFDQVAKFFVPEGTYTHVLDDISINKLHEFQNIAKLNGIVQASNGMSFQIYNETASNKLAYLAKQYNTNFELKAAANGAPYIAVSKGDIDNLINSTLDQRVLNPNIIKQGVNIEFSILDSYTNDKGEVILAKDLPNDKKPIGISVDGTLVEGLYLHDVDWLNATNLDNTKEGIIIDQNKLTTLRELILNNPANVYQSTILNRTPGVPILNSLGVEPVLTVTPDVKIGVVKNGVIRGTRDIVYNTLPFVLDEGKSVIVIPFGNTELALPTKRAKLSDEYANSIAKATEIFLNGKPTVASNEINSKYGINILSSIGLEQYMNMFINLGKVGVKDFNEYKDYLNNIPDGIIVTQFHQTTGKGVEIYYGEGAGIAVNNIGKAKYINPVTLEVDIEGRQKDLLNFTGHLKKLFTHVNLDLLGTNTSIPIIGEDGTVSSRFDSYDDFAKSIMLSPYLGVKLSDGTMAYTLQGRINFDIDNILESSIQSTEEIKIVDNTIVETPIDTTNTFEIFTTPTGQVINFNDAVDDFSPAIINEFLDNNENTGIPLSKDNLDEVKLASSSLLIKGIQPSTQTALIRSIVNEIQSEIIANPNKSFNIAQQVKLSLSSLKMIQDEAIRQGHPKASTIEEQVTVILDNTSMIIDSVLLELSKKKNVKVDTDNNELTYEENEEENDKAFELPFTLDPKTGMTDTVKLWLEGFKEKRILTNGSTIEYRNKTNLLGLNNYITFDVVYNDLLAILAKSNVNTGFFDKSTSLNEKYNTSTKTQPDYIIDILNRIEDHIENKPYLVDLVEKLKIAEPHIQNQFASVFNTSHTNHLFVSDTFYKATDKKDAHRAIKPVQASSRNIANLVLSEWQNSFKNSGIIENIDGTVQLNKIKLDTFKEQYKYLATKGNEISLINLNKWLSPIGIEIPVEAYNMFISKGVTLDEQVYDLKDLFILPNGIFKNIYDRTSKFDLTEIGSLSLEDNVLFDDSSFKELSRLISYYRKDLYNKSFKNGNGDTINGFTNDKKVIEQGLNLKSNITLLNELKADTFSQDSSWLNQLMFNGNINTNSSFYKYFNYFTSESLKTKGSQLGKTLDQLKGQELEKFSLGLFYNSGLKIGKVGNYTPIMRVLFPTMSDKAASVGYQVPGKYYTFEPILDAQGYKVDEKMRESDKEDLVKTLFFPELKRILKYQANPNAVNIVEWKAGAGKMLMFPNLNKYHSLFDGREIDVVGNIVEQGTLKIDVTSSPEHMETLKEALYTMLLSQYREKQSLWTKYGIIQVATKNKPAKLNYIDVNYKKSFPSADIKSTIFNYIINTTVANMNFQQLFIGDIALFTDTKNKSNNILSIAESTADNLGKRLAMMSAGKSQYNNSDEKFNVLVLQDNNQTSTQIDYITKVLVKVHGKEKGTEEAKKYRSLTASDAQEYTSLEEHLNLMFAEGDITLEDKNRILDYYNKTGDIAKSDKKLILQPTKPVYTGSFVRDGIYSNLYIKSSSFPLIKSLTKGTELDKLRELLDNSTNNIQRIAFKSAVKVGLPIKLTNVFDEQGNITIPDNWKDSVIENIPRKGHGKQQEVPYNDEVRQVNDGTQQAKEYLTNFMEIEGFIDPTKPEGENIVTGRELNNSYTNLYRKLFSRKQRALIKELGFNEDTKVIGNLDKLKSILTQEGLGRNYNTNDIKSLELNATKTNFVVPLWLNNSDSKLVSLLNSIVDNRVRRRKFAGKSFVLGSNAGLQTIGKTKGLVMIPDFDGVPKASYNKEGKMTSAEILIPFKFWDNNGKPLKLSNFTTNGVLDETKLPLELLELFGYRIPTSGVNLMSNLKIVGFLPEEYGDIVIAPADFIEQMGSDFDVDKLYTHMYNTYYDSSTGILSKLDNTHLDKVNNVKTTLSSISSRITELNKGIPTAKSTQLISAYEITKASLKEGDIMAVEDAEDRLIQNQLLDIHRAVLNNPNVNVQAARIKPLSFGELPSLAKKIYNPNNRQEFTVTSDTYQKDKYLSARAGKAAVGIFSLNMVFNSVAQQVEEKINFTHLEETEEGKQKRVISRYNIMGIKSNAINDIKSNSKYKSDVIEAFMAAALDNEKEQLLGKLNINNNTFDFIRAMSQVGYDEDVIISLINQPAILKRVEDITLNKTITYSAYTEGEALIMQTTSLKEFNSLIGGQEVDSEIQKAVLALFDVMSSNGSQLKLIQSAINSDSSGIGKNMIYSLMKSEQILDLPTKTSIINAEKLIGDYLYLQGNNEVDKLTEEERKEFIANKEEEGYINYKTLMIKPNSIGGLAGTYATIFNTQLWSGLYPYTNNNLYETLKIPQLKKVDRKTSINEEAKEIQTSITNYKSLLISNTFKKTSNYSTIQEAREDLLFDSLTHSSLGSIIVDLRVNNIFTSSMLDRLEIGRGASSIDYTGQLPTNISYYNAATNEYDEEILIRDIVSMIVNNQPLKEYNGEMLTTKLLAEKLITHQIITGGIQKSSQFIKYIPYEYLKQIGYYDKLIESAYNGNNEFNSSQIKDLYYTQTVQHYPSSYYDESTELLIDKKENGKLYLKEEQQSNIIVTALENTDRYEIFKRDNLGNYIQIDSLGFNGIFEWDLNAQFAGKSNISFNKSVVDSNNQIEYIPSSSEIANFLYQDRDTTKDISPAVYNAGDRILMDKYGLTDSSIAIQDKYKAILENTIDTNSNPILVHFAKEMLPILPVLNEVPLYVNTGLKGQAKLVSIGGTAMRIEVNSNNIRTEEELQEVLIEEMVHGSLKSELNNSSSEFTKNINNIRIDLLNSIFDKDSNAAQEFEEMENKIKNNLPLMEGKEKDLYYSLYNNDEFVAAAIKNKNFQTYLNTTEATYTTKTLWEKFIDAIKKVLVKLGVKDNSNLQAVLHETLNLFDKMNMELSNSLRVPQYVRSVDYINTKFNLVDLASTRLTKGNPKEIADFINSNIINVRANVIENTVYVESNQLREVMQDYAPALEYNSEEGMGASLKQYFEALKDRIVKLESNINKASQLKDFPKVARLKQELITEKLRLDNAKHITSVVALADTGLSDLSLVKSIMERPMTSEDLIYVRGIVNFWQNARENIFQEKHKESDTLTKIYGALEGRADVVNDKLFLIEKEYLQGFIKQQFGKDVSIDDIFENYKDINFAEANFRDISQYDNLLLNSIWNAVKQANIDTLAEGSVKLEQIEESLNRVIPILKSLGNKELFSVFRQITPSGKLTQQLVKPFTAQFFKDRYAVINKLISNNNHTNYKNYINWVQENGVKIKLEELFPANGAITEDIIKNRDNFKSELGEGIYNYWFKAQQRKITNYENAKNGFLEYIRNEYDLKTNDHIKENKDAYAYYINWLKINSPYALEQAINKDLALDRDITGYNNYKYYEIVAKDSVYRDSNFKTISASSELLSFYDMFNDLIKELNLLVPESQKQALAYGGVPSIEKTLFELYSERGMELGFAPAYNTFISSMQTNYNNSSITATDFATGKPRQEMRIPIIKDNYKEIKDYVDFKSNQWLIDKKENPSIEKLKEFEEEIVDKLAKDNSFDLGKIAKVYTSLVLAYKHKSKIEDTIKIANNVIDSYKENELRPDGTPYTNKITGEFEKKASSKSFIRTKQSVNSYVENVIYGNVKEEEGKGKIILTKEEKEKRTEIVRLLKELEVDKDNMDFTLYQSTKDELEEQLANLGKTLIYSKVGDNVLKYLQLKLMGWNALGGLGNMTFGWIANQIEAAGGQHFTKADLANAYRLTGSSVVKNLTFNKVATNTAQKIRNMMEEFDVLKDSSYELYTDSVKGEAANRLKFLSPFNISQRTEYLNQAPLLIALFKKAKVETAKGEINLYDGFTKEGKWNTAEYGEAPLELINKTRIKLDKLIMQVHGNYDNLSPLQAKRKFLGRAASQFRTFLFEAVSTRIEKERYDPNLDVWVKGRYRSVGTVYNNAATGELALETFKGILKQLTFGTLFKGADFNKFVDDDKVKSIDAINMRKVSMEVALAIDVQLFLMLLMGFGKDEDDDDAVYNTLFNQGTRMRTDLLLYINPNEAKNLIKDLIPALSVLKDVTGWFSSVGTLLMGEDEISTGVHEGDSKFLTATAKNIPGLSKAYSTYNSTSQIFNKD